MTAGRVPPEAFISALDPWYFLAQVNACGGDPLRSPWSLLRLRNHLLAKLLGNLLDLIGNGFFLLEVLLEQLDDLLLTHKCGLLDQAFIGSQKEFRV